MPLPRLRLQLARPWTSRKPLPPCFRRHHRRLRPLRVGHRKLPFRDLRLWTGIHRITPVRYRASRHSAPTAAPVRNSSQSITGSAPPPAATSDTPHGTAAPADGALTARYTLGPASHHLGRLPRSPQA